MFEAYELVTEPVLGRAPAMKAMPRRHLRAAGDQPVAAARRAASTNASAARLDLLRSSAVAD